MALIMWLLVGLTRIAKEEGLNVKINVIQW
jgi:hypothetical protein